ncbi:hypothetical protein [Kribbella sp. VKM Ac-2571]|uniref:hypothetical protein n=1 Tax=Kribbella sp. VKM Ac-2571 TaxID=2512222 RepID=UPI0010614AE2|nr:hypothetical protein [Kribbella sp. VKM Ac-2571]
MAFEFPDPGRIEVSDEVRNGLIDPGDLLLELYEGTDPSVIRSVQAELDRVRRPKGGYDLSGVKHHKRSGPLFLLSWITSGDYIAVQVWAEHVGVLRGKQKNEVRGRVMSIVSQYGIPVAATWTILSWASTGVRGPRLDGLNHLLGTGYYEWQGKITNGMVIDSIRKWRA